MSFLAASVAWLVDPSHWQGSDGIPTRVLEHLLLSGLSSAIAVLLALPLGIWLGHTGKGGFVAINVANVGRALPSLALLAFALPLSFALGLGLGFWPTLFALVPLGMPPILTNAYTGLREVDADVVDAARGMGMSGWEVLRQVELPIAAPLIIAGVRNAAVAIVATATLGAVVAGGGLGRYIVDGMARQEYDRLFVGAVLVALLAILTELAFNIFERGVVSNGVRLLYAGEDRLTTI
ncbi:MAG TPA: ABC transporter permease subunit [Chloroflexota bacterium]|jgi:osmoprotectant transport system permease protein|nr:ABC transporter permease subunit [Chloroflexota bacterium]